MTNNVKNQNSNGWQATSGMCVPAASPYYYRLQSLSMLLSTLPGDSLDRVALENERKELVRRAHARQSADLQYIDNRNL